MRDLTILLLLSLTTTFAFVTYSPRIGKTVVRKLSSSNVEEVDVIVIGAGIGGLSCGALTSKYGLKTICLEAHDRPGGVAHSFSRYSSASKSPFRFDSGPSLITGLSSKSTNPLRQVLDAIGTADEIDWTTYDGWLIHDYADGKAFKMTSGDGGEFEKAIEEKAGLESRKAFEKFKEEILADGGLAEVSAYIPPFALRGGLGAVISIFQYLLKVMSIGTKGLLLTGPFTNTMELYNMKDPFLKKWFDYLAFALSGVDASNTQGAPIFYMMSGKQLQTYTQVHVHFYLQSNSIIYNFKQRFAQAGCNTRLSKWWYEHFDPGSCKGYGKPRRRIASEQ
jgi:phytoene dehydrogenase-like protein